MKDNMPVNPSHSSPGMKAGTNGVPGGTFKGAGANVVGTKYCSTNGKMAKPSHKKSGGGMGKKGY